MIYNFSNQDGKHILEMQENRIDYFASNEFKTIIFDTIEQNPDMKYLVLDLRQVQYLASSCISVLVAMYEKFHKNLKYEIKINKKIQRLLGILGLSEQLRIEVDDNY